MTRRQFAAAIGAAGLLPSRRASASVFPVRYARANPFDAALRFIDPRQDRFECEKTAADISAKLERIFAGLEPPPPNLKKWVERRSEIVQRRFSVLPRNRLRFELKTATREGLKYHTGIWALPDYEATTESTVSSPRPYFRDVTAHVFGRTESFQKQLVNGNPYWRARLDAAVGIDVFGNQGIAVGDIDGDGVDEIYVCQPGGLSNRLYKMGANGEAQDITERAGLGILDDTTCALFADFQNSGRQDLVVLRAQGPLLFLNRGDGTFREQPGAFRFANPAQGSFTGMAAADYDRNGRLDLYLCCYVYFQSEDQYQFPAPYQDARNGPPNFLFRNVKEGETIAFEDVTAKTGMSQNNDRFSFAPAWCDYNGDGWPDLYVANDFGRNNLYTNREGSFQDVANAAGVADVGPGMSASWFDYDGDGNPDLYVSNMWTSAGQRVVEDAAFEVRELDSVAFGRHTKGNSLYQNRGHDWFEERLDQGVEMGRWAWSSGGFDFDLDGAPEILVTTGMVTNGGAQDLESFFWRQVVAKTPATRKPAPDYENGWSAINQLIREDYSWSGREPNVFYVRRNGKYQDASGISGFDFADDSRSFAVTDFDGDGKPDIVLKSRLGPQIRALQNDCAEDRLAIAIRLCGTNSNRDAIGARVEVNGIVQFLNAGSGFLSQHSKKLHFGLNGKSKADVKVLWPSGLRQEFAALDPGFTYILMEESAAVSKTAFAPKRLYSDNKVIPDNTAKLSDTWLWEPVPLPEKHNGPLLLLLHAGNPPRLPGSLPIRVVDLSREAEETAAHYALFRRYLFEYRGGGLTLPMMFLVDDHSCARKVYFAVPDEAALRKDMAAIDENQTFAVPFAGRYHSPPRRNYFKLGAAFYWAGYPKLALPYLEETVRSNPSNWRAFLSIARLHEELNQDREAMDAYQRLLAIHADYAPALIGLGEANGRLNDTVTAKNCFDRALAVDPANADAMNQLGILSGAANRYSEARDWFERAIAAQRDHAGAINNLGVLFAKMGKRDDSVAAFRYGIDKAPDDETLYLNLGRVYLTMNERDRARAVLTQLLQRKPDSAVAAKALAELDRQ